ncbi:hypothetical protein Tco_0883692 [Tanacetum coccineum]
MGYLVHAYYNSSPTRYYKDDPCWSADLKSKTTEDIISIGSFVEALVLNQYVLVRKILSCFTQHDILDATSKRLKNLAASSLSVVLFSGFSPPRGMCPTHHDSCIALSRSSKVPNQSTIITAKSPRDFTGFYLTSCPSNATVRHGNLNIFQVPHSYREIPQEALMITLPGVSDVSH